MTKVYRNPKKKGDKMAEIVGDAYDERYVDKANVIASALWLLAKSTKMGRRCKTDYSCLLSAIF